MNKRVLIRMCLVSGLGGLISNTVVVYGGGDLPSVHYLLGVAATLGMFLWATLTEREQAEADEVTPPETTDEWSHSRFPLTPPVYRRIFTIEEVMETLARVEGDRHGLGVVCYNSFVVTSSNEGVVQIRIELCEKPDPADKWKDGA